ncbi:hypothetical protein Pla8534_66410 [Lignipirellula cremea]|uniref:Uncharacterized protein n=1 Tax=Lignipirellula cremea TaxID=2528010 RepID=A0A518E3U9_9BACT|nr:hypothetical protein Pla8534_66410 [Lignipirellula cremea]
MNNAPQSCQTFGWANRWESFLDTHRDWWERISSPHQVVYSLTRMALNPPKSFSG